MDINQLKRAVLIRKVEDSLLDLFSKGKINGTVHTCVGQEYSALAFAGQLESKDFIFSNHRCHGHYIAFTNDHEGLIAEILGKESGTCGGIGSSQHLHKSNFYSNGIQGGIVPVAAGMALANKIKKNNTVGTVFIGDGTLGEGVVYETMNILSKWKIPLLIVLENNGYAQTTSQEVSLAGDILARAESFDIRTFHSQTWNTDQIFEEALHSIETVRKTGTPVFHLVDTYRLYSHSKGDDFRDKKEISSFKEKDPVFVYKEKFPGKYKEIADEIDEEIAGIIKKYELQNEMPLEKYYSPQDNGKTGASWTPLKEVDRRQVELINDFFNEYLKKDKSMLFIGEDVLMPYGGAFKVAKNLSEKYPQQIFSTPISESAITGIANGLALAGMRPYLEIMFGDFMTLCLDQIINHASKFYHMYNKQVTCPVVIRTPMGGGRGYGPTHSQSLEKYLIGIDNVTTIALNSMINPAEIYENVHKEKHPVIVIENKLDYGKKIACNHIPNYVVEKSNHTYPIVRLKPLISGPTATIVTYGGMVETVMDSVEDMFSILDVLPEIFILSKIHPLDIDDIVKSIEQTGLLITIEESSGFAGLGSEIIASIRHQDFRVIRIASLPVPIASSRKLESEIIPDKRRIIEEIARELQ